MNEINQFNQSEDGVIRVGQLWRDRRESNVRTLKVERVVGDRVELRVIRQEYQGEVTEPMRTTNMTVARLMSRNFILEQETQR
ncbi:MULTISPECIES: hypothetical protein [Nocardia]|uniref:hypothetical protein n=1 Tax=Nocardia TaxID=1817 RepID=UPI0007A3F524|nr:MULTISPECIES: hypothetical protein [Nocardia]NQE72663.1 hypothetical protein [Nocardia gamkensis]